MALRKPRLVCAENQGDVGEDRGLGAKRPVQKHLLRRVRQMVGPANHVRSEEHTSELQSRVDLVCRLLLEKKKTKETKQLATTNYSRETRHRGELASVDN